MAERIDTLVNLAKMTNLFVGESERFLSHITFSTLRDWEKKTFPNFAS